MKGFKQNLDKRTKELDARKPSNNPGQAISEQQLAQNQLQAIQNEQRANLLSQKQDSIAGDNTNELLGQAAMIGVSSGTMGVLGKYGLKTPPSVKQYQKRDVNITPNKITINNNTTNNTTTNIQGGSGGGQGGDSATKFKTWLNKVFVSQKEAANKRNLEYEKRESSLARGANRMLKRIEATGREVANTLNPNNIGQTVGNQLKILLMLFGMTFLSKHWDRVLDVVKFVGDSIQNIAGFFGIGDKGKQIAAEGGGFQNSIVKALGGDPKKKETIFDAIKGLAKEFTELMKLKFDHAMELRGEAIKSIKFPPIDLTNLTGAIGGLGTYLGNILQALVDPKSAMHSSIKNNIKNTGLASSMARSNNWRNKTFAKNTDFGDASVTGSLGGKKNYSLDRSLLDSSGNLNGSAISHISQSQDILGAIHDAKETGRLDTARMASGLQRLQDQVNKRGLVTVSPEFISQFFDASTLRELVGKGHIGTKAYKYVRVKRTQAEKGSEEGAYGFLEGGARAYGGRVLGEKINGFTGGWGGDYVGGQLVGNGAVTQVMNTNLGDGILEKLPLVGDLMRGINTTKVVATGAIEGGIKGMMANDYTLKLVPATDNSYGGAFINPSTGKPMFTNFYTLDKEALNRLASSLGAKGGIDTSDESFLNSVRNRLIHSGGGLGAMKARYKKRVNKKLDGFETLDIPGATGAIRDFDNISAAYDAQEAAATPRLDSGKRYVINTANRGIEAFNGAVSTAKNFVETHLTTKEASQYPGSTNSTGSYKGATMYSNPPTPTSTNLSFDINIAASEAIKLSSKKLYDESGKPYKPPYPNKSNTTSYKRCAGHVRRAIAAGLSLRELTRADGTRPSYAKDYVGFLPGFGFRAIPWDKYSPKKGDVLVEGPVPGHDYGHICINTGSSWVSDFVQRDMWGGESYRTNKYGTVFRHIRVVSNGVEEDTGSQDGASYSEFDNTGFYEGAKEIRDEDGNIIGYTGSNNYSASDRFSNNLSFNDGGTLISSVSGYYNGTGDYNPTSPTSYTSVRGNRFELGELSAGAIKIGGYKASHKASKMLDGRAQRIELSAAEVRKRAGKAVEYLTSQGIPRHAAIGIVGNLVAESGLASEWREIKDGKYPSAGIAMWNGDLLTGLKRFASDRGKDWHDFDLQLEYLAHDLKTRRVHHGNTQGTGNYKGQTFFDMYRNTRSIEEAAVLHGQHYEVFSGWDKDPSTSTNFKNRIGYAKGVAALRDTGELDSGGRYVATMGKLSYDESVQESEITNSDSRFKKHAKLAGGAGLIGDSWADAMRKDWPGSYITRGGDRIEHMIGYVNQMKQRPDIPIIVVWVGLNSIASGNSKAWADGLNKIADAAEGSVRLCFCTIPDVPANHCHPHIPAYNQTVRNVATSRGCKLIECYGKGFEGTNWSNISGGSNGFHLKNYKSLVNYIYSQISEEFREFTSVSDDDYFMPSTVWGFNQYSGTGAGNYVPGGDYNAYYKDTGGLTIDGSACDINSVGQTRREINEIIVHCTATPEGRPCSIEQIRRWHIARGFGDIGYHYVVYLDGSVHRGRSEEAVGAHTIGHNKNSIGVCYVGGLAGDGKTPSDTRTPAQKAALIKLLKLLKSKYPGASIHGHREFANKACPCFDAQEEYNNLAAADEGDVKLWGSMNLAIPLINNKTDEQMAAIRAAGVAGEMYINNPTFKKELDDGGMSFNEFNKQFQELSDENKKTYVLQKTAKHIWNQYKDNREVLDELGLDTYQKFLNTFMNLSDSERVQFEKRIRENKGFIDATNKMKIERWEDLTDEQEKLFHRNKWFGGSLSDYLDHATYTANGAVDSQYSGAYRGGQYYLGGYNQNGEDVISDQHKKEVLNYLIQGNINAADSIFNREGTDLAAKYKGNSNIYGYMDAREREWNDLKAAMLASDLYNPLEEQLVKLGEVINSFNDDVRALKKDGSGESYTTDNEGDGFTETEKGKKHLALLDFDQIRNVQSHLTDDFLTTTEGMSVAEKRAVLEGNKKIAAANKALNMAKFYYDPNGDNSSKDEDYFGATQELLERIEAEIRSGDLTGVYTDDAVKREAQKRLERYKAEYDKANEAKYQAHLEATKGTKAAAEEMDLYRDTSRKTAQELAISVEEIALANGFATRNEDGVVEFLPGGEASTVAKMVKEGKLSAQGYIDAKGLNGVITAEEIESGKITERALDENGKLRITDDIKNRARSVEAKRKYEAENKGKFWDNLSDAEKKKLTEGIKVDSVSEDAIKEATTAKDVANALQRDLSLGHVSNPELMYDPTKSSSDFEAYNAGGFFAISGDKNMVKWRGKYYYKDIPQGMDKKYFTAGVSVPSEATKLGGRADWMNHAYEFNQAKFNADQSELQAKRDEYQKYDNMVNDELDDDITRKLEESGNLNFDNNSKAVQDKVKYLAAKKKYEAANPGKRWEDLSAEERKNYKAGITSASKEDFEEARKLARDEAVKVSTQTVDLNAKDATEQLANKLDEMLGKKDESQFDSNERDKLKAAFEANGGALREVKSTLSDGSVITEVYNQKGELVTTLVPNDVKEKRSKNFKEMYMKLGFSSEEARKRQEQIEKETDVYRAKSAELAKAGVDVNTQIAVATAAVQDSLSGLVNMANGTGIRVHETSGAEKPKEETTEV